MGKKRYTNEELVAVASQYTVLQDFRKERFLEYDAIRSRGLLKEYCGHMKRHGVSYTDDELAEIARKYSTSAELRKANKSAYMQMSRRGLLKKLCAHMENWFHTEEELAAIANGYSDLSFFKKEQPVAYAAIQRKGLLKKLCGHMKRHMRKDYTDEELAELANRYDDLTLFRKEQRQPYFAIQRRGKLEEICGHMRRSIAKDHTDEEIRNIALKYKTKEDFRKNDGGAYMAAHRLGIFDKVCSHMEELRRPKGFYSKGYCHVVALGYKTISDFRKGNGYAYSLAWKRGWLDDICGHMEAGINGWNSWNNRKVYVYTFSDGYAYVGLTNDVSRRKSEHLHKFAHKKISPVLRHCKETGLSCEYKELTDWIDAETAARVEDDYIKRYKADGWKMLNRARGGGLGCSLRMEQKVKAIQKIVGRYEYVEDFRECEPEVYKILCDNRQFRGYLSGLKHRRKPCGYWTLERCLAVMPECNTATEFMNIYRQAYRIVKKAGMLDGYYPKIERGKYKKWTLENCATAARFCETKREFRIKHRRAYERLLKEGLLDELFEDKE